MKVCLHTCIAYILNIYAMQLGVHRTLLVTFAAIRLRADISVVKKKHKWNPMAGERWMEKTKIWKANGEKAVDTNTGGSPGYPSQSQ